MRVFLAVHLPKLPLEVFRPQWSREPASGCAVLEKDKVVITDVEWDKDDLESLGLLKIDVLALGMLSAIRRTLNLVSEKRGERFEMQDIPAEDPATYDMISAADTVGVFQIESRAQMSMLPRMQPRTFYDLVIEVAIVRPGPIQGGTVHPYLQRRQGFEPATYPSDALKTALGRTLGVPIFQEQVMQVAILAAGFTAARPTSCGARWPHGSAKAVSKSTMTASSMECSSADTS